MKLKALLAPLILASVLCVSCGKKEGAQDSKKNHSEKGSPETFKSSKAEDELKRAVLANNTVTLRRVIFENPAMSLNKIFDDGDTLLTYSIRKKLRLIRNILLEKGANPDLVTHYKDYAGFTPLMLAAHLGDINAISALLENKASINLQDWLGDTALHKAIKNGYDEAARFLIQSGANLKLQNEIAETPLETAEGLGRNEIAVVLRGLENLETGIPSVEVFRQILQDADLVNYRKIVTNHRDLVKTFASINPLVINIESPKEIKSFEIAHSLLSLQISPDGPEKAYPTPLGRAVKLKKKDFVELLLRFKADVNKIDGEGRPPLYYAIENNDEKMVDLLVNNGALEKLPIPGRFTFRGCRLADRVQKRLTNLEERFNNQLIQSRLGCFWTR